MLVTGTVGQRRGRSLFAGKTRELGSCAGQKRTREGQNRRAPDTTYRQEREHVELAIASLERLAKGRGKRGGHPPEWLKEAETTEPSRKSSRRGRSITDRT